MTMIFDKFLEREGEKKVRLTFWMSQHMLMMMIIIKCRLILTLLIVGQGFHQREEWWGWHLMVQSEDVEKGCGNDHLQHHHHLMSSRENLKRGELEEFVFHFSSNF